MDSDCNTYDGEPSCDCEWPCDCDELRAAAARDADDRYAAAVGGLCPRMLVLLLNERGEL